MRVTRLVYLFITLLATQPALAQSTYKLQAGDAVEIWMAKYTDLSRQVTLAPDGWISLPLAGSMLAEGMTLDGLQAALMDKLQPFFIDPVSLNVSLVPNEQHQPSIFVAGDVETPGLYAFRPGMTVLHAVSVAGGLYRPELGAAERDRSMEVEGLIAAGEKRLNELTVIIARLNAQIADKPEVALEDGTDTAAVSGFLTREQALLTMQRNNLQSQKDSLERLTTINEDSISALNGQIDSIKQRIVLAQERMTAASTLVDRGVMQASQVREIEVSIVDMEGSLSELRSNMALQQAAILTEQSRVNTVMQEFQVGLVTQLSAAERERDDLRSNMVSYRDRLSVYEPGIAGAQTLTYDIVRPTDSGSLDVDATEQSVILPGDLVRVTRTTLPPAPNTPAIEQQQPPEAASNTTPAANDTL